MWTHILKNSLNFEIFNGGGSTGKQLTIWQREPHPSLYFYLLVLFRSGSDKFESRGWYVQPDFGWSQCWRGTPVRPSWRAHCHRRHRSSERDLPASSGSYSPCHPGPLCLRERLSPVCCLISLNLHLLCSKDCSICFLWENLFHSKPAPLFLSPLAG